MVNKFFFYAFVLIGVSFSSTNAMKRKRIDNQPFEVNKKFCTNDFSIDTSDFDLLYGTNYLQEPISVQMAGDVFKYIPNQNYDKKRVNFFFNVGWNYLKSTQNLLVAMGVVFSMMDDDLWYNPEDDQDLYREAIAKALEHQLIIRSIDKLTPFFKFLMYNLHHGTNAKKLFEAFSPHGKAYELDEMLFACNKTLALTRRDILHNLEKNDFESIKRISEKIRFHPTMVTDHGQSILVWLIQNGDQLDFDLVKLFIGHVTWDKEAVFQSAQAKNRYDIITELTNFLNNSNDMID